MLNERDTPHPAKMDRLGSRALAVALNMRQLLAKRQIANDRIGAICGCDSPNATDLGSERLVKGNGMGQAKKLLAESGYYDTPVVIMAPGDVVSLKAQPIVAAQLLREAGFKVEVQAMDWQTLARRASQKPPKEGGGNMFFTNLVSQDIANPITFTWINGKGQNGGWFGWPEDSKLEELRDAFARARSLDEQKEIAAEIQARVYDELIYIPLCE